MTTPRKKKASSRKRCTYIIYPDVLVEILGVELESDYEDTDDSAVQVIPAVMPEKRQVENTNLERTTGVPNKITGKSGLECPSCTRQA